MSELIIIRGPSGSGKSTLARERYPNYVHCEADDYFMQDGVYNWDQSKLHIAHRECAARVDAALANDFSCVVANTSLRVRDVVAYAKIAKKHDADITVVNMHTQHGNLHGVPPEKVAEMKKKFVADLPVSVEQEFDMCIIDIY